MAEIKLYSVAEGKEVPFKVSVDRNGEVVAEAKTGEMLKFPAGLTKSQFEKQVKEHNKANEGVKARTDKEVEEEEKAKERSQKLVDSL